MPHVVADPCIKCRFTDCVSACPVDCFHEGANMLVIDPEECIDCGACLDECPTQAIYPEEDLPDKWREYVELNALYAAQWPSITRTKGPLETADEFKNVDDKRAMFDPSPGEGD